MKYEILSQLNSYKNKDKNRMHIPGHKGAGTFKAAFPVASIDVTELDYSDDLSCPEGVIKKAQEDLASLLGAKRAYITTDGSSSGVMTMLFVSSFLGSKVIVPRNSHKSVYNACRLLGLEPVIVQGEDNNGIIMPPSPQLVEKLIANDVNIGGMIITSPDYYGNIAPLEEYAKLFKDYKRLLMVDGAHGAHLALEEGKEGYAGKYADIWVDGAHKTLPTLTQGAVVCINSLSLAPRTEEGLSIFRTTSPSYPVMASVEFGVKYFINNPKNIAKIKAAVEDIRSVSALTFYPSDDWTKLALDFKPLGISPYLAQQALQKKGIYPEMNDGRYLLFYVSPATDAASVTELKNALLSIIANKKLQSTYKDVLPIPAAERTYSFLYAYRQRAAWIPLKDAIGKMAADNAGVTPPCVPVIVAGEIVTEQAVQVLSKANKTFGVVEGKIKIVKK